jgi:hypothetical protein
MSLLFASELPVRLNFDAYMHAVLRDISIKTQARQLGASGLFEPFAAVAPLRYNPYTEPQWRAAVAEFERCLAPIEQTVAANFKYVLTL